MTLDPEAVPGAGTATTRALRFPEAFFVGIMAGPRGCAPPRPRFDLGGGQSGRQRVSPAHAGARRLPSTPRRAHLGHAVPASARRHADFSMGRQVQVRVQVEAEAELHGEAPPALRSMMREMTE